MAKTHLAFDDLLRSCLQQLAGDPHVCRWRAKERDWVNYFAHRYLLPSCLRKKVLLDAAQMTIEAAVPQPPGYSRSTVPRDLVLWRSPGDTCWDSDWNPIRHPFAVIEWKVHRPGYRNPGKAKEDIWMRTYCRWQQNVLGYAIEVDVSSNESFELFCTKYFRGRVFEKWASLSSASKARPISSKTRNG